MDSVKLFLWQKRPVRNFGKKGSVGILREIFLPELPGFTSSSHRLQPLPGRGELPPWERPSSTRSSSRRKRMKNFCGVTSRLFWCSG